MLLGIIVLDSQNKRTSSTVFRFVPVKFRGFLRIYDMVVPESVWVV